MARSFFQDLKGNQRSQDLQPVVRDKILQPETVMAARKNFQVTVQLMCPLCEMSDTSKGEIP